MHLKCYRIGQQYFNLNAFDGEIIYQIKNIALEESYLKALMLEGNCSDQLRSQRDVIFIKIM